MRAPASPVTIIIINAGARVGPLATHKHHASHGCKVFYSARCYRGKGDLLDPWIFGGQESEFHPHPHTHTHKDLLSFPAAEPQRVWILSFQVLGSFLPALNADAGQRVSGQHPEPRWLCLFFLPAPLCHKPGRLPGRSFRSSRSRYLVHLQLGFRLLT